MMLEPQLGLSGVSLHKFTVNLRSVNISKSRRFTRVFVDVGYTGLNHVCG
jgi:hypothetical protein